VDHLQSILCRQNNLELLESARLRSQLSEAEVDACSLRRALSFAEQQLALLEDHISEQQAHFAMEHEQQARLALEHEQQAHLALEHDLIVTKASPTTDSVSHIQEHLAAFIKSDFKNTRLANIYFDDLYKRQTVTTLVRPWHVGTTAADPNFRLVCCSCPAHYGKTSSSVTEC
jgi:hypothetical protein